MHFCPDEFQALLSMIPLLGQVRASIKGVYLKLVPPKTKKCRYSDCMEAHPVAEEVEPISCSTCREYMGLPNEAR
jgi:hypothetical protein